MTRDQSKRVWLKWAFAIAVLTAISSDPATSMAQNERVSAQHSLATDLEACVRKADLIVFGEFQFTINDRKANAPIRVLSVLRGQVAEDHKIVARFRANALTISPKKGSKWIFFLQEPFEIKDGRERRKVIGEFDKSKDKYFYNDLYLNDDSDGIVPGTEENLAEVEKLIAAVRVDKRAANRAMAEQICAGVQVLRTNKIFAVRLPEEVSAITMDKFATDTAGESFEFARAWRYDARKQALVCWGYQIGKEHTWYEISLTNLPAIRTDDFHEYREVFR